MTNDFDIRWEQRFSNYRKALKKLSEAIEFIKNEINNQETVEFGEVEIDDVLVEIIKEGLIQRFEYTFEIAWNVMKDYALYQGNPEISGSRDAIRSAYASGILDDGQIWMEMIKSRVKTSHTYNEETATAIYHQIINEYYQAFLTFEEVMEGKQTGFQQTLFDKE